MPAQSTSDFPAADNQQDLYQNGVDQNNTYTFEPGTCVLPVAEDPPTDPELLKTWSPVDVIKLHAPYRVRRVSYKTLKQNNPPVIPKPQDTGAFVFLSGAVSVGTILNQSFTNFDWAVSGEYVYVENCVSRIEDGLILGIGPYQWFVTPANALQYGTPSMSSLVGAVAQAGLAPLVGLQMSGQISPDSGAWGYNEPSFFPGRFFSSDLLNGGAPVQSSTTSQQ